MEIYVDELPKDCGYCVFCKQTEYYYYCDKLHTKLGYFNKEKDCPLKPLSDRLAEERKKVVQEIRETIFEYLKVNSMEDLQKLSLLASTLTYDVITDKLDQIERGE